MIIFGLTPGPVRNNIPKIHGEPFKQTLPMSEESKNYLKVCCTCSYWSYKYKGFCHRLEQGAGKFWRCEDWQAAGTETKESLDTVVEAGWAKVQN